MTLNFKHYKWSKEDKGKELTKEEFFEKVNKEKDLKADKITTIIENHLKNQGLLTIRERNYIGYNKAPFDLTAGQEEGLKLFGFEIKSDKDTYERLDHQLDEYSWICEEVYIVLHKKEPPKWLPNWCGVLRISEEGEIYEEGYSYSRDPFDISTGYEWDLLSQKNGLGKIKEKLGEQFKELIKIRKNLLFNRYFAKNDYEKFYPLTEKQKKIIIGFDVDFQMKQLKKELNNFDKRIENFKDLLNMKQKKLT